MKRTLSIILFTLVLVSVLCASASTALASGNETPDLSAYQNIIDKINEKYDMSIESCEEYVQRTGSADRLLSMTPEEFEKSLLDDIATISAVRAETAAYLAGLPSDLVWQEAPMTESSSVNVTFEDILSVGKR